MVTVCLGRGSEDGKGEGGRKRPNLGRMLAGAGNLPGLPLASQRSCSPYLELGERPEDQRWVPSRVAEPDSEESLGQASVGSGELSGVWPARPCSTALSVEENLAACEYERFNYSCAWSQEQQRRDNEGWSGVVPLPSGAPQADIRDGMLEAGSLEVGLREVDIPEVGSVQVGVLEVGPH